MRKVRSLLSVLLVCCLLVNVTPIRAEASAAAFSTVAVPAAMLVASSLIGLGVSPGEDRSVFDGIVQNAVNALSMAGHIVGDTINVFLFSSSSKYGVSQNILQFIHDWLFSNAVITSNRPIIPDDLSETIGSLLAESSDFIGVYYSGVASNGYWVIFRGPAVLDWTYTESDGKWRTYVSSNFQQYTSKNPNWVSVPASTKIWDHCPVNYGRGFSPEIKSDLDINLGFVGSVPGSISDSYIDWAANSVTVAGESEDDEDIVIFPVGLGPDYGNTSTLTQEDVWAGTSDYTVEEDTDTGTEVVPDTIGLSEIWQAVKSIPSAFEGWFIDLIDLAGEIGEAIIGLPARMKEALTSLFQDVVNVGQAVVDAVLGIPQAITDVLTAIFVPDEAYVDAKVDAVYAQFPFVQSIIATGEELKRAVSGSSGPPVIYVDLGLAPSGDFGSQKVLLTDFSWYEPYKQRVDTLLSAALWALFGWRMYLRLPSIISGEGGIMIASERAYRKLGDD